MSREAEALSKSGYTPQEPELRDVAYSVTILQQEFTRVLEVMRDVRDEVRAMKQSNTQGSRPLRVP